jgi:hypothetical protein
MAAELRSEASQLSIRFFNPYGVPRSAAIPGSEGKPAGGGVRTNIKSPTLSGRLPPVGCCRR